MTPPSLGKQRSKPWPNAAGCGEGSTTVHVETARLLIEARGSGAPVPKMSKSGFPSTHSTVVHALSFSMPSITSEERRRRRTGGDEVDADGVAAAPAEEDEEEEDADDVKMMRSVAITQLCRLSRTSTQARSRDDR
tara:strand:+ start:171 stop:578 length:408 start_codon:yes stop_codon:yes gene_type:complete